MLYNLNSEIDIQRAESRFKRLLEKRTIIELKEKKSRSTSQNSYLHLILSWFGLELGYTLNEAKEEYKKLNSEIYQDWKDGEKYGQNIDGEWYRSSGYLDTVEMTKSIEVFRNYSAKEADVYLPSPDEKRLLAEIEVRASQNKEYL